MEPATSERNLTPRVTGLKSDDSGFPGVAEEFQIDLAEVEGPEDIVRLTADPVLTSVPAEGFSLMTLPAGMVLLDDWVTVPSTSPAPAIAVVAADCVRPTTFGTATWAWPVETVRLTADP